MINSRLPSLSPMLKRRQILAAVLCRQSKAKPNKGSYLRYIVRCNILRADWLRVDFSKKSKTTQIIVINMSNTSVLTGGNWQK